MSQIRSTSGLPGKRKPPTRDGGNNATQPVDNTAEALRAREERLRLALDAARMATWDWDIASGDVIWNDEHYRILGYEPGTVKPSYDAWAGRVHPEDLAVAEAQLRQSMEEGGDYTAEFRVALPNGAVCWIEARGRYDRDSGGHAVRSYGVLLDITERKRTEEALRESEKLLSAFLEQSPLGLALLDKDGKLVKANAAYRQFVPEIMPSRDPARQLRWRAWDSDGQPLNPSQFPGARALRGEHVTPGTEFLFTADHGEEMWTRVSAVPFRDENGVIQGAVSAIQDINLLKHTLEALRESQNRFQALTENLHSGVALIDEHGKFLIVNPAFLRMFDLPDGSDIKNINDRNWGDWQVFDEDGKLLDVDEHPVRKAAMTGKPVQNRLVAVRPPAGRDPKWMFISAEPIHNSDGRMDALICTYYDITERKQAEETLFETNQRLEALMNALPVGVSFSDDATCQRITGNPAVLAQFAVRPEDNLSASAPDPSAPGRQVRFFREGHEISDAELPLQQAVAGNQEIPPMELEIVMPSGRRWFAEASGAPVRDAKGNVIGGVAVTTDITGRKQAEDALRAAKNEAEKYAAEMSALMDAVPTAIFIAHDTECRHMSGSRATQEMLGLPATANFSKSATPIERPTNFRAMKDGQEIPADQLPVQRAARGEEVRDYEFDLVFADGTVRTLFGDAVPLLNKSGEPHGAIGAFIEVTERRRAEELLRNSERMYRAIGESIDYGIWICEPDGRNIYASESFLKLVGLTQQQCSDFGWGDILHPDDAERTIAAWKECVRTGGTWDIEHRCKGVDGLWHAILARGVPVRDEKGEITCWAGINLDISHLKKAEQALRDADRRKNEFLAMLAHELRNPLAPVRYAVQIMNASCGTDCPTHGRITHQREIIERQIGHMAHLIDDLLDVARVATGKIVLRQEMIDLVGGVRQSIESCRHAMEQKRQDLIVNLPEEPLWMEGDLIRLEQVFTNLLGNAIKYSPQGRRIWVSMNNEQSDGNRSMAVVRVWDEGEGISPDLLPHVFELFAQGERGKDRAQGGLGIGLTMVQKLTQMHGGSVEARSDGPGKGSEFVVRLPLVVTESNDTTLSEAPPTLASRSLKVLVVDDVADSAESLAELLGLFGHQTRIALSGAAALETVRFWQPAVVLLDIGMPGMDGIEVVRRLRAEHGRNGMTIIALTGYGQESDRMETQEAGFDDHLTKPVDLNALQKALEKIM